MAKAKSKKIEVSERGHRWLIERNKRLNARVEALERVLDSKRQGGGETIGDTLIRLANEELTEDWRGWLKDHGARINQALTH